MAQSAQRMIEAVKALRLAWSLGRAKPLQPVSSPTPNVSVQRTMAPRPSGGRKSTLPSGDRLSHSRWEPEKAAARRKKATIGDTATNHQRSGTRNLNIRL